MWEWLASGLVEAFADFTKFCEGFVMWVIVVIVVAIVVNWFMVGLVVSSLTEIEASI